jgi:phosphoribosylanthranilate isomerase
MPTKIKICGITNFEDASAAAKLGASFLGLNFFENSARYLDPDEGAKLANKIKNEFPDLPLVGVFVNESVEKVKLITEICELDILQLHGEESPEFCQQFEIPVWRAFQVKNENSLDDLQQFLKLDGIVLDAFKKGEFGGTGQTFDWELIHKVRDELPFFILAGGMNPKNVGRAIEQLRPNVVDLASGVEVNDEPRKKDLRKMEELFEVVKKLS